MVWVSFVGLNETFNVEGSDGYWEERYITTQASLWGSQTQFRPGHRHSQELKNKMSESHTGKTLSEKHKQNVSKSLGKTITYKGEEYHSIREASRQTGDNYNKVRDNYERT